MIVCSIDVTAISKERIKPHANGKKYYSFVVVENDEPDRFGNTHAIKESISKEERLSGVKAKFIGNGKLFTRPSSPPRPPAKPKAEGAAPEEGDDVPF
jgi:hypothetical protein